MRALVQRVARAEIRVAGERVSRIGPGLLILLGVGPADGKEEVTRLATKIARARIFPDERGLMNRDLEAFGGAVLVVSQFTLFADLKKGESSRLLQGGRTGEGRGSVSRIHSRVRSVGLRGSEWPLRRGDGGRTRQHGPGDALVRHGRTVAVGRPSERSPTRPTAPVRTRSAPPCPVDSPPRWRIRATR